MTRVAGTAPDAKKRVNFKPDGWQLQLLDVVDENSSALVVAPTASGKTFIGYYVMDKILRADHSGVAVYIAPTKALVNQVSAEIYARFSSKNYPMNCKNELLGVFIREFNSAGGVNEEGKWKNCQVLVTTPHILEMLLLSPTNQDWVSRLRYVVFDEVHCIGNQEEGVQWEHTMQLIPCPFIALSATVADPSFFHGWLQNVSHMKKLEGKVEIVQHTERWNDLYKFVFHDGVLRPLHPFSCLIEKSVRRHGLASDMSLTPQEMVSLFQEVRRLIGPSKLWDQFAPGVYFEGRSCFITKSEARQYEKDLKAAYIELVNENVLAEDTFRSLAVGLQQCQQLDAIQHPDAEAKELSVDVTKLSRSTSYLQPAPLFTLCSTLHQTCQLPAIVFNFSASEIRVMLSRLLKELENRQHQKYFGDEEAQYRSKKIMEKREAEYRTKLKLYEEAVKMKASKNQEAKAARKNAGDDEGRGAQKVQANEARDDTIPDPPAPPVDLADEIDPEFSFHSAKALGQGQEDIEEIISNLKYKRTEQELITALRRGIGLHHPGTKKVYRDAVEVLFRRGFLTVVFATETLALGINMPCKTTVFCGDSLDLNGLMYRQMSGRAGRRGFDLMGQVVFWDMAFSKIQRLITSNLFSLNAEFVQSPTTVIRALVQWEQLSMDAITKNKPDREKEDIAQCLAPMFSLPFFRSEKADLQTQVKYQTRYAIELLHREGLIYTTAYTQKLANFVSHLFESEPANLFLSRVLCSGALHEYLTTMASQVRKDQRQTHLTVRLAGILGWFMQRRRLPRMSRSKPTRKKHLPSDTCPRLPSLPEAILKVVQDYNASTFELFQELAFSVASSRKFGDDDVTLPFTTVSFQDEHKMPFSDEAEFRRQFLDQRLKFKARSPFAAMEGSGDTFSSPADLVNTVRSVLHLDIHMLPIIPPPVSQDFSSGLEPTNSWIVDYLIHGKKEMLSEDNGLHAAKVWTMINKFKDNLKMVLEVLKTMSPKDDIVLTTTAQLVAELHGLLNPARGTAAQKRK